jgi:glucose dehydrogenase
MGLRGLSIMRDAEVDPGHKNLCLAMLVLAAAMLSSAAGVQAQSWSVYGGDAAGTRYSPATGITKANVAEIRVAWTLSYRCMAQLSPTVPSK